jgi:hypothetical protein
MPRLSASRAALALATLALAAPALTDPAADYARLAAAFPGLSFANDPGPMLQGQTQALEALSGQWILAGALMEGGTAFPDPDLIAGACARSASALTVTGPAALRLTRTTASGTLTVDLTYAGGTSYVATYDQAGFIDLFFGGRSAEELGPDLLYGPLTGNIWLGHVSLLPVSKDLILVLPQARTPELLVRCP